MNRNMARKTEKFGKGEKINVRPGIWRVTLKNVEHEKWTLQDLEQGKKHCKTQKMRNAHCRTWNNARNLKNVKNMRHTHWKTWNMARNTEKCGK